MKSKMLFLFGIPMGMLLAWFLISPLFIDERVDEPLPGQTAAPAVPDMQQMMADAANAPDRNIAEAMPAMDAPKVLLSGTFSDADEIHQGSGDAAVYALPDGKKLLRFENFNVTNGPDLVVYLTNHKAPASAGDVTSGFLKLAALKGNVGSQNYEIPADVNLDDYGAAVIWCELFGVLFSAAPLNATASDAN